MSVGNVRRKGRVQPRRRPSFVLRAGLFEGLESRTVLSTLDVTNGVLTYTETFGTITNVLSIQSTGNGISDFYTITDKNQPITLTRNAIAAGWAGDTSNTVSGPSQSVTQITMTADNEQSNLFVESIDAPASVSGFQAVNVGQQPGGTSIGLQGIRQPLSVDNAGGTTSLTLDDTADPASTSQTWNVATNSVTGPSPKAINFNPATTSALTLDGDNAGNTFNVADTGSATTVNSGTGFDTINVTGTTAALTVNTQAAANAGTPDLINITGGTALAGPISIQSPANSATLALDDSGTTANHNATLNGTTLSGFTAQPITFSAGAFEDTTLTGGSGNDTLTVDFSAGNPLTGLLGVSYNGGGGVNALALTGGSFNTEFTGSSGPGAGFIDFDTGQLTYSNLSPITDTVPVGSFDMTLDPFANTAINIVNGPNVGGLATTEINSGNTPPTFELMDLANKTNIELDSTSDGGSGTGPTITLNNPKGGTGLTSLSVVTGPTDDTYNVTAIPAGIGTTLNTGGGNDVENVNAAGLGAGSSLTVNGGGFFGANVMNVNAAGGAVSVTGTTVTVGTNNPITFSSTPTVNITNAADAPLAPTPATVTGTEGIALTNVQVGSFSDADTTSKVGGFTATINWGDGSPATTGTITQPGGPGTPFDVSGSHTYEAGAVYKATVSVTDTGNSSTTTISGVTFNISDTGGSTTSIASTANIAVAPVTAVGLPLPAVPQGQSFTAPVASFRVGNPNSTDVFTASINWGDGTAPSAGTITRQTDGSFRVSGTHSYAVESPPGQPYTVTVTIVDPRGGTTTVTTSATVLERLVVTTAADSGRHSLRDIINVANAEGIAGQTITFNIPGAGPHTIVPLSPLPAVTVPVVIDATTQPGFAGRPIIAISGTQAGNDADGLTLSAGNTTVKGLDIGGFDGAGIVIAGRGGDLIIGNEIGTDLTGATAAGNGDGIDIDNVGGNVIGGLTAAARNVISGNSDVGLRINGPGAVGNVVEGNFIGTSAGGNAAVRNFQGVFINGAAHNLIGGTLLGSGNVISGNASAGVQIFNDATIFDGHPQFNPPGVAAGNVIQGNFIGTNAAGTAKLPNAQGIFINDAPLNQIGGTTPAAANVISGNRSIGVDILGDHATRNAILGNDIGTDRTRTLHLGNNVGVYLYSSPGNVVDLTSDAGGNAIVFNPGGNVRVRSLSQGPQVERIALLPASGSVTGISLSFTTYLDRQRASNPASYTVSSIRRNGSAGPRVTIASVTYDDINRLVTLTFASPVPRTTTIRLVVQGTAPNGLTDQAGNFLDGSNNVPRTANGSNYQAIFINGVLST